MELNPRALLRLTFPVLVLSLAVAGRGFLVNLDEEQLTLAGYLPYVLAVVSLLLAYQFNRSRFLLLALFTGGSFWVIRNELQAPLDAPGTELTYLSLALSWPLSHIFLLLAPERGILNRWGFLYGLSLGVLALAAPRLVGLLSALLAAYPAWLTTSPTAFLVLPWYIVGLFVLGFVIGIIQLLQSGEDSEVAILTTLVAGFVSTGFFDQPNISLAMVGAAGLIQAVSLLRSSHAMAYRDELTRLPGRRALTERLKGLGPRYSLAMVDVDHFKQFNDTHGHDVGDEVLKLVASRLDRVRSGGKAFRYGGEEFCIVFPRKRVEQCIESLEELRTAVAGYQMTLRDKEKRPVDTQEGERRRGDMATRVRSGTLTVTISLGLAEPSEDATTPEDVLKAADMQLYRAKKMGRNRLCY